MICFRCENEGDFEIQERDVFQDYLGCVLKVKTSVTVCKNCDWECLTTGQLDELRKRTKQVHTSQLDNSHWYKFETLKQFFPGYGKL